MSRRNFVLRFLAAIVAFFVGLWPRKALAASLPPVAPPPPPVGTVTAAIAPGPVQRPQRGNCQDIEAMLDSIREHTLRTGDQILPCDEPMRLLVGYAAVPLDPNAESRLWQISIHNLKNSLEAWGERAKDVPQTPGQGVHPSVKVQILREYMKTAEGRLKLGHAFPGQRR